MSICYGMADYGLRNLDGLTALIRLELDSTRVTDAGVARIAHLPRLQGLDLGKTALSDAGMAHLRRLPGLRWLDASVGVLMLLLAGCGCVATAAPPRFSFPVQSASAHYARTHHDYPAADIFAPCGTSVVAPVNSMVEETKTVDRWRRATDNPNERSGLLVALVDPRGVRYYGSHLATVRVRPGQAVSRGAKVGTVGETGNAAGTGCHLHFGLSRSCRTGWQIRAGQDCPAAVSRLVAQRRIARSRTGHRQALLSLSH